MFKDYYKILGISYPSTSEEIKNAFHKQAKRWHPDHNPGMDTTSKMQDIVEAYSILKDEESRRLYNCEYELYVKQNSGKNANSVTDNSYTEYDFKNQNVENNVESARDKAKDRNYWDELLMGLKNDAKTAVKGAWDVMKYFLIAIVIFNIIGVIILLCSDYSAKTSQSLAVQDLLGLVAPIIKLPEQEIPKDWNYYQICETFELAVPPTVELRNEYDPYTKMLNNVRNVSNDKVVFQPKGLSTTSKDALSKYCRIISQYIPGENGDFPKSNETEPVDNELRQMIEGMVENELAPGMTTIGDVDIDWVSNGKTNALRAKYTRPGTSSESPVQCQMFLLFNDSEAMKILLSYRKSEYDSWNDDFDKVIYSFCWKTQK